MTQDAKVHLYQALLPLLISRLPEPFSPTEAQAKQVAEAAQGWVNEIESATNGDSKLQMFFLGAR